VQLSLNFLTSPHPATPLERLDPERRAELIQALARIITKASGRTEPSMGKETATTTPIEGNPHD
jgi:uncharacterized tellurite resistance protein B-like protein